MAKQRKNSGIERQAAIMGQFTRLAKQENVSVAVERSIQLGIRQKEYAAKQPEQVRVSFRFLTTGK